MSTERDAGLQALQQGNPAAAAPLLETACQQNPADFDALLFLGAAYGQIGRQMDAINTITKAVQVQPANAQARYNLAVAMEQGGYKDQAITALGQALTLQPDYPKAQEALRRLQGGASPSGASVGFETPPLTGGSQAASGYGQPASGTSQPSFGQPAAGPSPGYGQPASGQAPTFGQPASGPAQSYGQPASGPAPSYGQPASGPAPSYGQPSDPSSLPQAGFGRVPETPAAGGQPPAYPPAGGGFQAGGYGQPQGGALNQGPGVAPAYGPQTQAGAYGAQQQTVNPYGQPGAPGQYGQSGAGPNMAQQGPYPYNPRPLVGPGGVGVMPQTFNLEYAGFGARFAAWLLDTIILVVAGAVVGFVLGLVIAAPMAAGGASIDTIQGIVQPISWVVSILLNWLYFALFESSAKQGTPGKQALGIKVTDLEGNRIGFGRATGRFFGKIISGLILCIGYLMVAFTDKKQALHDMMAGTLVVKR